MIVLLTVCVYLEIPVILFPSFHGFHSQQNLESSNIVKSVAMFTTTKGYKKMIKNASTAITLHSSFYLSIYYNSLIFISLSTCMIHIFSLAQISFVSSLTKNAFFCSHSRTEKYESMIMFTTTTVRQTCLLFFMLLSCQFTYAVEQLLGFPIFQRNLKPSPYIE